jgi:hypothetical protein
MLKYCLWGPGEAARWSSLYPGPSVVGAQDAFCGAAVLTRSTWSSCFPLSGSLVDRIFYGEPHSYGASLSDVRVIMTIMHVLVVKLLC